MDEKTGTELTVEFTKLYIGAMEKYYEQFWPSFQKMLNGTRFFKGSVQQYDKKHLLKPCFFLWVLIYDIAGARHKLKGTPFLTVFDRAVPKKLGIPELVYDTWISTAMEFFERIPMSGLEPPPFYALYGIIYKAFDQSFRYNPAEKRLVRDAGYNMARTIYSNSILKKMT